MHIPSFKVISLSVLRRRFLKGFYNIWAWQPSWSCDLDSMNKFSFPDPIETPKVIWSLSAVLVEK